MTTICMIRHGETDWNVEKRIQGWQDTAINQKGKQQAALLRLALELETWDIIITSPLQRAKHTAEIINEQMDLPVINWSAFKERGYGDAEGMLRTERQEKFPDGLAPSEESRAHLLERAMEALQQLRLQFPEDKIILMTHGGVINSILKALSNGEMGSGITKLDNTGRTTIQFKDDAWHILQVNDISHLEK